MYVKKIKFGNLIFFYKSVLNIKFLVVLYKNKYLVS